MHGQDNETPFENPPLTEGYPLDRNERRELEWAIQELDRTSPPQDERPGDSAERPAAATS
jgi:hypothetical protein